MAESQVLTEEDRFVESEVHVAGLGADKFNRQVGVLLTRFTSTFTPVKEGQKYGSTRAAGKYYGFKTTRSLSLGFAKKFAFIRDLLRVLLRLTIWVKIKLLLCTLLNRI
jgi:hypothetical protein